MIYQNLGSLTSIGSALRKSGEASSSPYAWKSEYLPIAAIALGVPTVILAVVHFKKKRGKRRK